jgi:hypothetical protein
MHFKEVLGHTSPLLTKHHLSSVSLPVLLSGCNLLSPGWYHLTVLPRSPSQSQAVFTARCSSHLPHKKPLPQLPDSRLFPAAFSAEATWQHQRMFLKVHIPSWMSQPPCHAKKHLWLKTEMSYMLLFSWLRGDLSILCSLLINTFVFLLVAKFP